MAVLETKTIAYNGDGVSSSMWIAFDSIKKENYRSFLDSLSSNLYDNALWLISYEIYIPDEYILTVAPNVTLVANGGFFSTTLTGILRSNTYSTGQTQPQVSENSTRISSNFEKIFDDKLNFAGTWGVKVAQPEWFGYGSNSGVDDSIKIQKAINLIHISYSTGNEIFYGGRVECRPLSSQYSIMNSISIPLGVSFDGGNSNFIYKIADGTEDIP